ncbi:MAG: hypothetical protein ACD_84C00039G0010 [uncultured bacterium]|nr:MAG: hypothetical protein ACD_84C00039G0010 [uncultured bacterium]
MHVPTAPVEKLVRLNLVRSPIMDKETLLELYPEYTSVLGPYTRPDGRKHVVLNNANASKGTKGKTKTISYPKALVEINLKARLEDDETVDHDDRDFTNDDLTNLKVKVRGQHASEDALRVEEVFEVSCLGCGFIFVPSKEQTKKRSEGKAGPFCSRPCVSRYTAIIRKTGEKPTRDNITVVYGRVEK